MCKLLFYQILESVSSGKGGGGSCKRAWESPEKSHGFLLHSLINTQSSTSLSGNSIYRGFVQEEWILLAPRAQASPIAI